MRLALTDLSVQVPNRDIDATRAFYASRPARVGTELGCPRTVVQDIGNDVTVRIIEPSRRHPAGVYLYLPPGGFFTSSAVKSDARNAALADATGAVVVTVDYRLAPEHPWPAAPDDCEAAAEWLSRTAADRFGTTKFVIGGMSAGSTLAMTTLLRLRDRGLFLGAVLEAGTYDLSARTPAGRIIADEYFIEAYVGHVVDRTLPDISPVFGELVGLPPTLVVIGSDDVLLADNLAMTSRLAAHGNDVDLRLYPFAPHGFTNHPTPVGRRACEDVGEWIASVLSPQP